MSVNFFSMHQFLELIKFITVTFGDLLLHLNCQIYKAKEIIFFYHLAVGNYCYLWLANYPSVAEQTTEKLHIAISLLTDA